MANPASSKMQQAVREILDEVDQKGLGKPLFKPEFDLGSVSEAVLLKYYRHHYMSIRLEDHYGVVKARNNMDDPEVYAAFNTLEDYSDQDGQYHADMITSLDELLEFIEFPSGTELVINWLSEHGTDFIMKQIRDGMMMGDLIATCPQVFLPYLRTVLDPKKEGPHFVMEGTTFVNYKKEHHTRSVIELGLRAGIPRETILHDLGVANPVYATMCEEAHFNSMIAFSQGFDFNPPHRTVGFGGDFYIDPAYFLTSVFTDTFKKPYLEGMDFSRPLPKAPHDHSSSTKVSYSDTVDLVVGWESWHKDAGPELTHQELVLLIKNCLIDNANHDTALSLMRKVKSLIDKDPTSDKSKDLQTEFTSMITPDEMNKLLKEAQSIRNISPGEYAKFLNFLSNMFVGIDLSIEFYRSHRDLIERVNKIADSLSTAIDGKWDTKVDTTGSTKKLATVMATITDLEKTAQVSEAQGKPSFISRFFK